MRPTFERFDYTLRPAKSVERKMLCDAFARVLRIDEIGSYRYIGFGSLSFADFALFHRRLGFRHMTSIEGREDASQRIEFNRPYSCISMQWGRATDRLREMEWNEKRSVVWLDYDKHLNAEMLGDVSFVVSQVLTGSMVLVTSCADPGEYAGVDAPKRRLETLKSRVGSDRVPVGVKGGDLSGWGLARVSRRIINDVVTATLRDRNGGLSEKSRVMYEQLFNFHYADGSRMVTVGGIVVDAADRERFGLDGLTDLDFIRRRNEEYRIEMPVLTWRETSYLDRVLAGGGSSESAVDWLPGGETEKYGRIARFSPTYIEAEL